MKYIREVLIDVVHEKLQIIVSTICANRKSKSLALDLVTDHLLIEVDPQYGIQRLIKEIKRNSFHLLGKKDKHLRKCLPTLCANSYFISTVGLEPLSVIKQYFNNQKSV